VNKMWDPTLLKESKFFDNEIKDDIVTPTSSAFEQSECSGGAVPINFNRRYTSDEYSPFPLLCLCLCSIMFFVVIGGFCYWLFFIVFLPGRRIPSPIKTKYNLSLGGGDGELTDSFPISVDFLNRTYLDQIQDVEIEFVAKEIPKRCYLHRNGAAYADYDCDTYHDRVIITITLY